MTTWAQDAADALDALGDSPTPDQARAVTDRYPNVDVLAAVAARGGGGGGGTTPVSCVLARDNSFDVRTVADHDILWDALYDNYWDFNTLLSIPTGLGLSFAFDGTSGEITTTSAGVWAFTIADLALQVDATYKGTLHLGVSQKGLYVRTDQPVTETVTTVLALPSGVSFTPRIQTATQATSNPYVCNSAYMIATKLG